MFGEPDYLYLDLVNEHSKHLGLVAYRNVLSRNDNLAYVIISEGMHINTS